MIRKKGRKPYYWGWVILITLMYPNLTLGVKPVFDYSNNMRLVLLPADTKLGSVIYRLRASDGDEDYPLKFAAFGKCYIDCPSSKGNHAPHPKFERTNGKNTKSKFLLITYIFFWFKLLLEESSSEL